MNNNRIVFILILVSFMIFHACENKLDLKQPAVESADGYYKDEATALELLVAIYSIHHNTWPIHFNHVLYQAYDYRSADAILGDPEQYQPPSKKEFNEHFQTPTTPNVEDLWEYCYAGVGRANTAIQFIKDVPEEEFSEPATKKKFIAEARCIRAMYYSYLVQLYGDIPLVLEPLAPNPDVYEIFKSKKEDVLQQIYSDCKAASASLGKKNEVIEGRASKGLAMTLWARNLAWEAGTDGAHPNWDLVFKITDSIMNGAAGNYGLMENYKEIWMEGHDYNKETIYEISSVDNNVHGTSFVKYNYARYCTDTVEGVLTRVGSFGFGTCAPTEDIIQEFETGGTPGQTDYWEDPRLEHSVWREGDLVPIGTRDDARENDTLAVWLKDSPTGYYMKKYWLNNDPQSDNTTINSKEFRLADIILLHAEAAYYLKDEITAREDVNIIRERARGDNDAILPDVTASGQELLKAIWHERRVELCFEHQRWFDVVRQGKVKEEIEKQGYVYLKGREFLPIPQSEIDLNPKLEQNPNYE